MAVQTYRVSPILLANKKLLLKQRAVAESKGDSVEGIRGLLRYGFFDRAKSAAEEFKGTEFWPEIVRLFKVVRAIPKCSCGQIAQQVFDEETLQWNDGITNGKCLGCVSRKIQGGAERSRQQYKDSLIRDIEKVLIFSGVPARFLKAQADDFDMGEHGDVFGSGDSYFFYGPVDTGKTHLAAAVMRSEIYKIEPVNTGFSWGVDRVSLPVFVNTGDLLLEVQEAACNDKSLYPSVRALLQSVLNRNLVVLDGLDVTGQPSWALNTLFMVLDRRYRGNKRTIITANHTLDEIKREDIKIASRIAGLCKLKKMCRPLIAAKGGDNVGNIDKDQ